LCNDTCGWNALGEAQSFTIAIDPAFPQFQTIALTEPKLANTLLSTTFTAVKIEKMLQAPSNNQHSFNTTNSFNSTTNTFNYLSPDDESKILGWLSPLEPGIRHRDIGAQRLDSIGSWVLETQEFRCWHGGSREDGPNHPTLFCHGNPGAGKSYMM